MNDFRSFVEKTLLWSIIAVWVVAALSGCGGGDSGSAASLSGTNDSAAATPARQRYALGAKRTRVGPTINAKSCLNSCRLELNT